MTDNANRASTTPGFDQATGGPSGFSEGFAAPLDDRPTSEVDASTSNAAMVDKILSMPLQPYGENGYVVRVLEARGRRSGATHRVPIAVVQFDGELYLVSPRADRAWARNLAANGSCALLSAAGREPHQAISAQPDDAVSVLGLYLSLLRWASAQFPFTPDATPDQIRAHLDEVAVYQLQPAAEDHVSRQHDLG